MHLQTIVARYNNILSYIKMYKLKLDINLPLANRAVMCPVRLNRTTFRTFKDDLPVSKPHLLYHLLRCITFGYRTLRNKI